MFTKPKTQPEFYSIEEEVLRWWKQNQILERSIDARPDSATKTFYDGPITANGEPHAGHMLTFAMKDIIPRFWTMKGYKVTRSLGWDCQGIPVEYEIEKKLGFKEKKDIEKFGIEKFNQLCRESVMQYKESIVQLEELMGRLTNADEEYATMDSKFIESIWWSLKELYNKGLLYKGFKVVPYSTRAGTTLSNAEVALGGYKPFVDPAVTVEFRLEEDPNTAILAWTTTPWTLPTNFALAVGEEIKYVKVKDKNSGKNYIVAEALLPKVFEGREYEIIENLTAQQLVGKKYIPLFDFFKGRANCFVVVKGFHVTTDSGTGIVHLAPYGEEDNEIFKEVGIEMIDVLDDQGDFTQDIPDYAGMNYREANPKIVEALQSKGLLFKFENYEHEMPMCWRTSTPLIYKPISSWYIKMSSLRSELVANNEKINWTPKHVKQGRFGNWLAEIKDWGISRSRYWGTPLPIWQSDSGKIKIIGGFEELEKLSGKKVDDPHRPYIDDFAFEFEGETYKRIPDVLDVWYDSGAMPFARFHYPFENQEKFEKKFPAQYIAESVDQTRGWFYSLLAISTALFGKEAYENVVMSGFTLDDNGVKQSKSKKNYTDPRPTIAKFGADTVRLNFFVTPISAGEDTSISDSTLKNTSQEFMIPLWNIFSFFVTYANMHNWEPRLELARNTRVNQNDSHPWDHMPFDDEDNEMDSWVLAILQRTIKEVNEALDNYEIPKATRAIRALIDDISKWYIRRSRDRFAEGEQGALDTLYYVLIELSKLLAPFAPFISEHMYRELAAKYLEDLPESVHLCDYPSHDASYLDQYSNIIDEMKVIRAICEMGHSIRTTRQIKVRQPLGHLEVISSNPVVPAVQGWMEALIEDELNIKEVHDTALPSQGDNFAMLEDTTLQIKINVDLTITEELRQEGLIREITRAIQSLRKTKQFVQGDLVKVEYYSQDAELKKILQEKAEEIKNKINASLLAELSNQDPGMEPVKIGSSEMIIKITKE